MTTIKDVAKLAGVSTITASRALNNPNIVSDRTIEKVKAAAKHLKYQPSTLAKGLRAGQTRIITLVVIHKDTYDPLLFEFAAGVSVICREQGYSLLIYLTDGTEKLTDLIGKVDGLILTDIKDHDHRIEELHLVLPVALFGQSQYEVPQIDVDNFYGAKLATDYLQSKGHKDVVFLSSDSDLLFLRQREQGYLASRQEAGYEPYINYSTFDARGGYEAIQKAFQSHNPEAIFCSADIMAIGALRYLHQKDIKIPVIGFDGGYLTELTDPPLTSIKQPFFECGQRLASSLFENIKTGKVIRELIKPELVIKGSA